jgi:hypothetical protein
MLNDIEIFQVIWSDGYITLILGLRQIGLPLICGREVTGDPPTFNITQHKEAIRSGRYKG